MTNLSLFYKPRIPYSSSTYDALSFPRLVIQMAILILSFIIWIKCSNFPLSIFFSTSPCKTFTAIPRFLTYTQPFELFSSLSYKAESWHKSVTYKYKLSRQILAHWLQLVQIVSKHSNEKSRKSNHPND